MNIESDIFAIKQQLSLAEAETEKYEALCERTGLELRAVKLEHDQLQRIATENVEIHKMSKNCLDSDISS
jgi:uncharacterized cysteine cluster protein YcgN (CxxCxxCC family)